MKVVHTQKFIRTTPRKLREVADIVRFLEPNKAVEVLPFTGKRAALVLKKVIQTTIANASDSGVTGRLVIKEIQIGEGPRMKRGRAASRGKWQPFKRRMSHVRVVLETTEKISKKGSGKNKLSGKSKPKKEKTIKKEKK